MTPLYWVSDDESMDAAKAAVSNLDVRGFSARGADRNGRVLIRCWNGKGDPVAVVLFRKDGLRLKFARHLTAHLGVTVDVKGGISKFSRGARGYPPGTLPASASSAAAASPGDMSPAT